ncbi:polar amino acid transport system permease protein [Actinoplanes octamycinicus]|uniref:Polar amino acid transport system permease protein n=1 Tax=Actinoplanes octamycinicus TaxID=135948 RepID=A0A7W7M9M9_9ACTN|nr:amino acid ABC transporter permease [Actinoplanes octamycinicus]MBB4742082.1 polar amino acid transport system permease protein [Actinoplanes octamycinicus]GIE63682.1 polar amino acid ABC transporter permease [Actinoplanes octamycinicus]
MEATGVRAVPVRHYGRWVTAAVVTAVAVMFLNALIRSPNLQPGVIRSYLFKDYVLHGVGVTLLLTGVAMGLGTAGAVVLAVLRLSANPVLKAGAWAFIWFFRGTPLLVQIIFWGFLGALFPRVSISLPGLGTLFDQPTSVVISGTTAAVLALSLNEMAYAAEIVRSGLLAVDRGQTEAAYALGMSPALTLRRIVLPQAMRVIVPPMGNETITMLKSTALVSVIAGHDLMTVVQGVYGNNYQVIPLLTVAALWYLALVSVLSAGQYLIERRFGRGTQLVRGGIR